MIEEDGENIERELRDLLGEGLAPYMTAGVHIDDHIMSSQKVGLVLLKLNKKFVYCFDTCVNMRDYIYLYVSATGLSAGTVVSLAIDALL